MDASQSSSSSSASSRESTSHDAAPRSDTTSPVVYLNGLFMPRREATIDIEDRGFIFADGVYEVIRYYDGRAYRMAEHAQRLARSLAAIDINAHDIPAQLAAISDELVARNHMKHASIYWQITRGSAMRNHLPPTNLKPTVMAIAYPAHDLQAEHEPKAITASLQPDQRWARCDIKTIMLLANVMAKHHAHQQGAYEALLHRDGIITEGSSTSALFVRDGVIHTHPANERILDSITRRVLLALAQREGKKVIEQPLPVAAIHEMDEVMIAGTTTHVAAVTQVDGQKIGQGKPGPVTKKLHGLLKEDIFSQSPIRTNAP